MKFGVLLPQAGRAADPAGIVEVAIAAERLGFDSAWVGDHVILPASTDDYPYAKEGEYPLAPDRPFVEAFTTLAFAAAVTSTIRLGVGVCIVPYRPAALLAKVVASVDFLSNGRLVLGAASGWSSREFHYLGAAYDRRGVATDDALELMRTVFASSDGRVTFDGELIGIDDAYLVPLPPQGADLPIWIGGASKPAQRRAARLGSAWFPPLTTGTEVAALATGIENVRQLAEELGRPGSDIELNVMTPMSFSDDAARRPQWPGEFIGTGPEFVDRLRALSRVGVANVVFQLGGSSGRRIEFMERFATEVLPELTVDNAA